MLQRDPEREPDLRPVHRAVSDARRVHQCHERHGYGGRRDVRPDRLQRCHLPSAQGG